MSKKVKAQFVGFVIAGGVATVVNYGLFLVLFRLNVNFLLAASIGYLSGIVLSFTLNRVIVYGSRQNIAIEFVRYFLAYLIALAAQLGALGLLVAAGLAPELANAVAIVSVVILNFFVVRRFVFASNRHSRK